MKRLLTDNKGIYANVYTSTDNNYVVKQSETNDGWLCWAAYCMLKRSIRHYMPRIKYLHVCGENKTYTAVVEKLKHQSIRNPYELPHWEGSRPVSSGIKRRFYEDIDEMETIVSTNLGEAIDLHMYNIMIRERTKALVFNDPLSSWFECGIDTELMLLQTERECDNFTWYR